MADLEKVLKGLECCAEDVNEFNDCLSNDCPYKHKQTCCSDMARDALELLKEHKPVEPKWRCEMAYINKIIKGLEDFIQCYTVAFDDGGEGPLIDTLALLKAQEPRVMSVGDLYGEDMGFYERKDEELVWPVLIARGGPDDDGTVGIVRKDAFEIKADCGLMNQTWRIWTAYPTHEQREAVKWDDAE